MIKIAALSRTMMCTFLCLAAFAGLSQAQIVQMDAIEPVVLTDNLAAQLQSAHGLLSVRRTEDDVPGWTLSDGQGNIVAYVGSTWEIADSVGYSGRPIDVLVALGPDGRIVAVHLNHHEEPILTLGLSDADIARFVGGFVGVDPGAPETALESASAAAPDVISRATVSTGVIRDSILRTARLLAIDRGLVDAGLIDRSSFEERTFQQLLESASLVKVEATQTQAAKALSGARVPVKPGDGPFLDLWVGIIDPPSIGQNLLGQSLFTRVSAGLGAGKVALFVGSRGVQSHRGTKWRRSHVFDRIAVIQDGQRFVLTDDGYTRIDRLAPSDAPDMKERSVFHLGAPGFDPVKPFRIEITATRPAIDGPDKTFVIAADYVLPAAYVNEPFEPEPLWRQTWERRKLTVIGVGAMLVTLTLMLFLQESLVRRPRLWRAFRLGFLSLTLLWLGWGVNGQLSVVQVVAFLQSLLTGFRWETFLIEPVIFMLWGFVALGLLFWGRGVYCGWLCPFGALQELSNALAQKLGVPQIAVPHALHERLWAIKYTLFIAILALSFYSMHNALILAEAEPFKTAISLRMLRAWPFVLFVLILLGAGLFIERFYCRYLCPLGAALAIPAKLKVFDWLNRRPQCGRECRLCEQKCTVGAIDPLGRINPNECVLCLRCQVVFNDSSTCPTLMKRERAKSARAAAIAKARESTAQ